MDSKIKITNKKLIRLNNTLPIIPVTKKDRLTLAIIDFRHFLEYPIEKYTKKKQRILRETAAVDGDGNFYLNTKGEADYNRICPGQDEKREKQIEDLLNEETELTTSITADLSRVKTLPIDIIKLYNGVLWNISKEQLDKIFLEEEPKTEQNGPTA